MSLVGITTESLQTAFLCNAAVAKCYLSSYFLSAYYFQMLHCFHKIYHISFDDKRAFILIISKKLAVFICKRVEASICNVFDILILGFLITWRLFVTKLTQNLILARIFLILYLYYAITLSIQVNSSWQLIVCARCFEYFWRAFNMILIHICSL